MTDGRVPPAPLQGVRKPSLFLAGGITGCPDWQAEAVAALTGVRGTLLNPRRPDFLIDDPDAAPEQIRWEHRALHLSDAILFWFPAESICPIALYELGAWSMTAKPLMVGVHPEYARHRDVEIQTRLARPDVEVVYSLEALAQQVRAWVEAAVAQ